MNKVLKYCIIVFLLSVLIGYFIGKYHPIIFGSSKKTTIENEQGETKDLGTSDRLILETANLEEKLLPTATLVLEKKYEDCKHTVKVESELPPEMINLTEDEIKEIYTDWIIKDFSKDSLTLYKLEKGLCGEHFVIDSENGIVTVYKLDENYDKSLYEKTDIYTEYLPEKDIERLKEGIYVYGTAELNAELENLE